VAKNAGKLADRFVLTGWLHQAMRNLAANAVRADVRCRTRENEAAVMNDLIQSESDTLWNQIERYLDHALAELKETGREALLLRFFERKSAREMAQALGTSEEAAQTTVFGRRVN
jgi:RNA polymerase sigma factor (sigma-70 family)